MSEASSPRFFSTELKVRLLLRLQAGETVAGLAREAGVAPQLIYGWREAYRAYGAGRGRKAGWRAPKNWPRPRRALPSSSG
jgi:transposase-like protein